MERQGKVRSSAVLGRASVFLLWATGTVPGSKTRRLLSVVGGGEMKESGEPQGMKSSPTGLL